MVPTISFRLFYGLLILQHDRRQILWLGVTAHPTAEWISRQLTEAYGWNVEPRYIIRDRDAVYGDVFIRRLRAMGIRDRPTAARSPCEFRQAQWAETWPPARLLANDPERTFQADRRTRSVPSTGRAPAGGKFSRA